MKHKSLTSLLVGWQVGKWGVGEATVDIQPSVKASSRAALSQLCCTCPCTFADLPLSTWPGQAPWKSWTVAEWSIQPEHRGTRRRDSKQVRRLKIPQGCFEDWFWQGRQPRRRLRDDGGVLALSDLGVTAAAGQRGLAAGLA